MPRSVTKDTGILLGLALVTALFGCSEQAPEPPPPPLVEVTQPTTRDITEYFHYTGTLEPSATAEIRARVGGFLESIDFEESTKVESGQVLFTIEKAPYEIAVGQAEAEVARAEAAKSLAEARLSRTQQAFDADAANEIELIEEQANLQQAEAELLAAKESLEAAKLDLSYTDVSTPITGLIDRFYIDEGNLVGRDGPTLLATVVTLDPVRVTFDVSETIALRYLADGRDTPEEAGFPPVAVALADEEGFPHAGRVDFADNQLDEATGTLTVRAELPNPTQKLYPGLFARIRVPWDTIEDAVLIHEEAVGTGLEGKYVFVLGEGNVVSRQPVTLGERQDDGLVAVLEGLEGTETYIVRGLQKARPGSPVTPKPFGEAPPTNSAATPAASPAAEGAAQ